MIENGSAPLRSVLVVGASSGVGQGCVQQLIAQAGFRVFAASRQPVDELGTQVEYIPMDVTSDQSVRVRVCLVEPGDLNTKLTLNRRCSSGTIPESVYFNTYQRCLESVAKSEAAGQSADKVAAVVMRRLKQRKPALRTRVSKPIEEMAILLRRLGWISLYDRLAKSVFRLPP